MLGADQKGTESRRQGGALSHQQGGGEGDLSQGQFDFSGQRAHSLTLQAPYHSDAITRPALISRFILPPALAQQL